MTTWTTCIKITRVDNVVVGISELDVDLLIDGVNYVAGAGYTPSTLSSTANMAVDYADIEGVLDEAGVEREDIRAGLYNKAFIEWFLYDYVAKSVVKVLGGGYWGEVTLTEGRYTAEFNSIMQLLQQEMGNRTSPTCRAKIFDDQCKLDPAAFRQNFTVTSVTDDKVFFDIARLEADGYWDGGTATFDDDPGYGGENAGHTMEIKRSALSGSPPVGRFELFMPLAFTPQVGDAGTCLPGCDGHPDTCKLKYDNFVNFDAENFLPGQRNVFKQAGQ